MQSQHRLQDRGVAVSRGSMALTMISYAGRLTPPPCDEETGYMQTGAAASENSHQLMIDLITVPNMFFLHEMGYSTVIVIHYRHS